MVRMFRNDLLQIVMACGMSTITSHVCEMFICFIKDFPKIIIEPTVRKYMTDFIALLKGLQEINLRVIV